MTPRTLKTLRRAALAAGLTLAALFALTGTASASGGNDNCIGQGFFQCTGWVPWQNNRQLVYAKHQGGRDYEYSITANVFPTGDQLWAGPWHWTSTAQHSFTISNSPHHDLMGRINSFGPDPGNHAWYVGMY